MDDFGEKLRLLYSKLFDGDIDRLTEALIDYQKFKPERFDLESEEECKKQFFLNRKTVLRRWLLKGSRCTSDFQKSFSNYALAHYRFKGRPLFVLEDFQKKGNLEAFEDKLDNYLLRRNRIEVKSDYRYLYWFCSEKKEVVCYEILHWKRTEGAEIALEVTHEQKHYQGSFLLSDEGNIFITLDLSWGRSYFLFHDNNDASTPYIVGTSMGYLPQDNKIPRAQKVLFAKERLDEESFDLLFILNETEVVAAVENRQNLYASEFKLSHFFKYATRFKHYTLFFQTLIQRHYQDRFYYRLAFREFFSIARIFDRIAHKGTYFIYDYSRALCELIETLAQIKQVPLYMVMELHSKNIFIELNQKNLEIKERLLALTQDAQVQIEIIFIQKEGRKLPKNLVQELLSHNIKLHTVAYEEIVHEVNSIDFLFINLGDHRDFVLADPLRDSKEVYKLFIHEEIMDEYKSDYQKLLFKSTRVTH